MKKFLTFLALCGSLAAQPLPTQLQSIQDQAEEALRRHDFPQAVRLCKNLLESRPQNEVALIQLGQAYLALNQLPLARQCQQQLKQVAPQHPEALALGGILDLLEGHPAEAASQLELALTQGRTQKVRRERLAVYANSLVVSLYESGQKPRALQACEEYRGEFPEQSDLWICACRLYRELDQVQKSADLARQGTQRFPQVANFYASLALAEARLGRKESSEDAYRQLLQRDSELAAKLRPILDGIQPDRPEIQVEIK